MAEGILRNLLDLFVPNAKLLAVAGKNLTKSLQGVSLALSQYVELLNKLAADSLRSPCSTEIGESLKELAAVIATCEKTHNSIVAFFKQEIVDRVESDAESDPKIITENIRGYQKGQKIHMKKAKETLNNLSQVRKKALTKGHGQKQLELEITKLENEASAAKSQLDHYESQSQQLAANEERKRYAFLLDRHCQLMRKYQDYQLKTVESFKIGLHRWTKCAQDYSHPIPLTPESVPQEMHQHHQPIDYGASRVYESLDEMTSRETVDLSEEMDVKPEVTTTFISREPENSNLFNGDQHKASLDEHFAEALDAGYQSFRTDVPPEPVEEPSGPKRYATAVHYYKPTGDHQLKLEDGDFVQIKKDGEGGWQYGVNLKTNDQGWFPASRVREQSSEADSDKVVSRPQSLNLNFHPPEQGRRSYLDDEKNGYARITKNRRSLQEPRSLSPLLLRQPLPTVPENRTDGRREQKVTFSASPPRHFAPPISSPSVSDASYSPPGQHRVVVTLPPKLDLHQTNFDTVPRNNPFGHVNLRKVVTSQGVPKKLT